MRRIPALAAVAAAACCALAPVAAAHVTVRAGDAPDEVVLSVPNESQTAATTRLAVRLPQNVLVVRQVPLPGWSVSVETEPLAEPLVIGGETVTERPSVVTWSGGSIPVGARADFPLGVRVRAGTPRRDLAFPAVQTYADGEVVRWIGPAGSDKPAGVLAGPAAQVGVRIGTGSTTSGTTSTPTATTTATAAASDGDDDDYPLGLAIAGAVVVGIAIVIGIGVAARRRRGTPD